MIRLALAGAAGRMGRAVLDAASRDARFTVTAALSRASTLADVPRVTLGDRVFHLTERLSEHCDVLVDFTVGGTAAWLEVCSQRRTPMVIGATGLDDQVLNLVRRASERIAIVRSANFSPGIQAILGVLAGLAEKLGRAYDIELVETHHRHKQDAPSGTALMLVDELLKATRGRREENVAYGRHGASAGRPVGQIGVHAVRMGEIVGKHEVHLSGPGETITLTHQAQSREAFAAGALRAAAWLMGRPAGLYSMKDVLESPE